MSYLIEVPWDCPTCGSTNRGGPNKRCATCGSAKSREAREHAPDPDASPVTAPAEVQAALAGPDLTCRYCGAKRSALDTHCAACGAELTEPPAASPQPQLGEVEPETVTTSRPRPEPRPAPRQRPPALASEPWPPADLRTPWWTYAALGGSVVLALLVLLWWGLAGHDYTCSVARQRFVHTSTFENRTTEDDQGWAPLPGDAFASSCRQKYYGDEDCHPYPCRPHLESYMCGGHSCNCYTTPRTCTSLGNGYASCSGGGESCSWCTDTCTRTAYDTCYERCPVYKDWCTWKVFRWHYEDSRIVKGGGAAVATAWDEPWAVDEIHRIRRTRLYEVYFSYEASEARYEAPDMDTYNRYETGRKYTCEYSHFGGFRGPTP